MRMRSLSMCSVTYWLGWGVIAVVAYMQFLMGGDGDKNWLLVVAHKVIAGERLYRDILETNPPFIVWLYTIPAGLERMTSISDIYWLVALQLALIGYTLHLCDKVLSFHTLFGQPAQRRWHGLLLAAILILWANSIYFGDREHIFITCVFPYLLRWMPGVDKDALPRRLRLRVGLLAAVGFCIKPHTVIFACAVALIVLWRKKTLQALFVLEHGLIVGGGFVYLLLVWRLYPDYFSLVLPMELATYSAYRNTNASVFLYMPAFLSFVVAFSEFRVRRSSPFHADILYLMALVAAGVGYALANNGWLYTLYPLNSMVLWSVYWMWREYRWLMAHTDSRSLVRWNLRNGVIACGIVMILNIAGALFPYGVMWFSPPSAPSTQGKLLNRLTQIMEERHVTSFGAVPISSYLWPRLVHATHIPFVTRFHHLWMLPRWILAEEEFRKKNGWIITYITDAYVQDLSHNRPQILFVDSSPHFGSTGKAFDVLALLKEAPAFRTAFADYRFAERVDYCDEEDVMWQQKLQSICRYDVYERIKDGP